MNDQTADPFTAGVQDGGAECPAPAAQARSAARLLRQAAMTEPAPAPSKFSQETQERLRSVFTGSATQDDEMSV
jgi:hypothetical protein